MARETAGARSVTSRTSSAQSRTSASSRPTSSATRTISRPDSSAFRSYSRPNSSVMRSPSPYKPAPIRPPSSRLSRRPSRQNSARLKRQISQLSTVSFFDRAKLVLCKPSAERVSEELNMLEGWFRKKSKLFEKLNRVVLLDVVKHCQILTVPKDYVIIQQGLQGNSPSSMCFYIILRGQVSILVKDDMEHDEEEDSEDEDENPLKPKQQVLENTRETDRSKLGHFIGNLSDGRTFGELALLSKNCVRAASIIADEDTDLILISRELYNRSVARIVSQEYEQKLAFVENCALFRDWATKWKRSIAMSVVRHRLSYDETLARQGDAADSLYFITSGELKLVADPEQHKLQFADFIKQSSGILHEDKKTAFPQGLVHYLSAKSRQANRLKSANDRYMADDAVQSDNQLLMSPSAARRKTATYRATLKKYNVCYLEQGQMFGDVEFLTGLNRYHATAVCTKQLTVVMRLHKVQFNRFFRKKNADTVTEMCKQLGVQIPRRMNETIQKHVPMVKYIIVRLDEINGTETLKRRDKVEIDTSFPRVDGHDATSLPTRLSRAKSGVSSRSYPMSSRSFPLTGTASLHEPVRANLNLPTVKASMSTYLNTQVQHIIGSDGNEQQTQDGGMTTRSDQLTTPGAGGGVYSMATPQRAHVQQSNTGGGPLPARAGIFFKLMQVTQMNVEKEDLAIESEEFNYLCQLRRRIARELNSYYPFASLESFLNLDEDQRPQTDRRRKRTSAVQAVPQKNKKLSKSLPNIRGAMKGRRKKAGMKWHESQDDPDQGQMFRRTHVAFSMPAD